MAATDDLRSQCFYRGTRADLKPGDLIDPDHPPDAGERDGMTTYVYLTRTLDAATWGAELAVGEGPGRIYIVEPTGPIEEDPNLTDKKFRGNPTKSYRSREPLRVTGEVTDWQGHSPATLKAMKDGLERQGKRVFVYGKIRVSEGRLSLRRELSPRAAIVGDPDSHRNRPVRDNPVHHPFSLQLEPPMRSSP